FFGFNTYFEQNNVTEFETETPSYSLMNLGFGGEFNMLKNTLGFRVSCNNLSDKQYISHLSRLKSDNIYNIGRNINIGLTYMF
ncbi:MAG: TonB-dependent receptor, partial [Bacteroidia bacterium]|nr:TonB-dependent receptor [Bacteroidia bacterium]